MTVGILINNQRGHISGPCRLCGGSDKARLVVPTALLVRVQCLKKSMYMAVEGPSTRPIVFPMIPGSYSRLRRRFTIFVPEALKLVEPQTLLSL